MIWVGLLVSFTGSSMQNAALLWHVSLLASPDKKGLALGLVGLVRVVPIVVFSLVSGGVGCLVASAWIAAATPARRHDRSVRSAAMKHESARADGPGLTE